MSSGGGGEQGRLQPRPVSAMGARLELTGQAVQEDDVKLSEHVDQLKEGSSASFPRLGRSDYTVMAVKLAKNGRQFPLASARASAARVRRADPKDVSDGKPGGFALKRAFHLCLRGVAPRGWKKDECRCGK